MRQVKGGPSVIKDREKLTDEQWELVGALLPPLQQPEAGPRSGILYVPVNGALVVKRLGSSWKG